MMTIFLLFSLFSVVFSQQLIKLSSFKGDNQRNDLLFPAPYSIYISAEPDWWEMLSDIYIVYEDGTKISLDRLTNNKFQGLGELQPYVIQKSSYLITSLDAYGMKYLKGVMFISTPKQVQDKYFSVFNIHCSLDFKSKTSKTILFLNTHENTNPFHSAIISNWQPSTTYDSSVFIYPGLPSDSIEPNNPHIFSNPMYAEKKVKRFDTVETFSLTMVAFYLRVHRGFSFKIEPGYWTPDRSRTISATTTGFYMKPLSKNDSLVTINTVRDASYIGSTGVNIVGHLSAGAKVTVAEYGGAYNDQFSTPPNDTIVSWSTSTIGSRFTIASTPRSTGYYYVQYFVDRDFSNHHAIAFDGKPPLQDQ